MFLVKNCKYLCDNCLVKHLASQTKKLNKNCDTTKHTRGFEQSTFSMMTQENNESFCKILFSKQQANTHLCEERKNVCCLYLVSMLRHLSSLHHWERETSFNPFVDLWCDELFCVVYEGLNESVVCTGRRAGQATWTRRLCDQGWKTVVTLTALAESMPTLSALVLSTLDVVTWTFFLFYLNIFDLLWKKGECNDQCSSLRMASCLWKDLILWSLCLLFWMQVIWPFLLMPVFMFLSLFIDCFYFLPFFCVLYQRYI